MNHHTLNRSRWMIRSFLISVFVIAGCSENIDKYHTKKLVSKASSEAVGLTISWFGAASVVIDDGTNSILIDPFVSRSENSIWDIAFHRHAEVAQERIHKRVERPEIARGKTILVGHSHYDHSLDIAHFAVHTKAQVFGSPSAKRIVHTHGYNKFKVVYPGNSFEKNEVDGRFKVSVLSGLHGDPLAGFDPLDETVSDPFPWPATVNEYGLGNIYSFFIEHEFGNVLHIGSAGIVPGSFDHLKDKVDVVMLSLVGRRDTNKFLKDVVGAVNPRFVIPIHYDNLFRPLNVPIRVGKVADLSGYFSAMEGNYPNVDTGVLLFDEPWKLPIRTTSRD